MLLYYYYYTQEDDDWDDWDESEEEAEAVEALMQEGGLFLRAIIEEGQRFARYLASSLVAL